MLAMVLMLRDKSLNVGFGWITEPYHVSKLSTQVSVPSQYYVEE